MLRVTKDPIHSRGVYTYDNRKLPRTRTCLILLQTSTNLIFVHVAHVNFVGFQDSKEVIVSMATEPVEPSGFRGILRAPWVRISYSIPVPFPSISLSLSLIHTILLLILLF